MTRTASVIVNNHNYERFLGQAIESALAQTHRPLEVIVVDDGSTDASCELIASFGARVTPVLRARSEGQNAAFNDGFAASHGEVVLFLDADDVLTPAAVEAAVARLDARTAKVHWPLWEIDAEGGRRGTRCTDLPEGDLLELAIADGPDCYSTSPTSGNAWPRTFLHEVIPMPVFEGVHRNMADAYLSTLAPVFGEIRALAEPLSSYRIHGTNAYAGISFDEKLRRDLWRYDVRARLLADVCARRRIEVDPEQWLERSWLHRLRRSLDEVGSLIPASTPFILVDEDSWGLDATALRRPIPFPERDGRWWGPPADDAAAVAELERLHAAGAQFAVFAWPAFWWLEHYTGLREHLVSRYTRTLANDRVVVFDLRAGLAG